MAERGGTESRRPRSSVQAGGRGFDFTQALGIADALPMQIALVGPDLRYQFLNQAYAEFVGLPRSQILGRTMREVLGEAVIAKRLPMLEAALAGERQWFASDYDHPARGTLTLQIDYMPQHGPDGGVTGIVILINDVTEQRIAERALIESEARFRRIADSAPVMMWVTRIDRTRDFVNDAYVEFTGLSREEARVLDWRTRIHPDDVDRIVAESIAGEASYDVFTLEGRYRRHDGEYRWLRSVSQPRFGPDGELIGFIGAATDVTIAKEAELGLRELVEERTAKLAESEARVRAIFETVQEVIVLMEPDGTILEMNRVAAPWRADNPTRAIGGKIWDSPTLKAHPEHIETIRRGVAAAASGEPVRGEYDMHAPSGAVHTLEFTIHPITDRSGKVIRLLAEARDVTELKAAQEQLRQAQKMEALGQLTGGIAHDFNNLLTVVVGGLDMIAKQVDDERLKRYATNALNAAERGARLTGQLLSFSRLQRLEVKPTYVAPLIEEMRPLLRNVLGPGITKQFDLDPHLMPVMADPTQLEVAVLNLAINARDAMPDGGTLTFASRKRRIRGDPELADGDYVELSIADTGAGMEPDVAARAFDPFFTTKDVGKGTGLGLSMVYGMARQSGGTARIDSEPGVGTTVSLFFRRAKSDGIVPLTEGRTGDELRKSRERLKVLVIDDDEDVRHFIAQSLEESGHEVHDCGDGAQGLAMFADVRPDLVVLDFIMPGMTGAQVAERIRADTPGQPILFVSGYSESDAITKAAPDAQLLTKPFLPDALADAVHHALANGKKRAG
jgi:PAS domain S-box-containing protein